MIKSAVPSAELPDRVGQVLLGKLRVLRHLGGGGMGDVYEVEHLLTHHRRALKIVRPELARQPRYVERLLREASIAGRLKTPFVAETLDAGRLEDGSAYVLMELLAGRSLHDVLELDPRLPQRRVANIMAQVAEGMTVAHAAGIVHRDLKPENVFLVGDDGIDRVKILDFGISRFADGLTETATRLTREGTVLGTPFYMAPEQAAGKEIDARADVWAIGVMAYEALTGKLPFAGSTVGEVMMLIGAGMYPPIGTRRPDVDPAFAAVIDRALRPDPRDRFESAEQLRRELLPFATNEPAARAKTISDGARAELTSDHPLPLPPRVPKVEERRSSDPSVPPASGLSGPPPDAAASRSVESGARARPNGAIVLGVAIVLTVALTVAISASRGAGTAPEARPPSASATAPAPAATVAAPEGPDGAPLTASAALDAGTAPASVVAPAPEQESDTHAPPRTRVRQTPAEAAGLEANPYGP